MTTPPPNPTPDQRLIQAIRQQTFTEITAFLALNKQLTAAQLVLEYSQRPIQPETTYLVIGQHRWGKGATPEAAKDEFRNQGGQLTRGYSLVKFAPPLSFTGVDGMGSYRWTGDGLPEIMEYPPKPRNPR